MTDTSIHKSGLYGSVRAACVQGMIYPLDVVKKQLQQFPEGTAHVVCKLWKEEGIKGFYRGCLSKSGKIVVRQFFRWPLMTRIPALLRPYKLGELKEQAITGLCIAKIDALTSKHLDRSQVQKALFNRDVPIKKIILEGMRGYPIYWSYLSVAWVSSLVSLKFFKTHDSESGLTRDLRVGFKAGVVVSLCVTPFDCLNTLKQSGEVEVRKFLRLEGVRPLFRGWHLQLLMLVTHNIGTQLTFSALNL